MKPLWLRPEAIPEGAEETEPGLPSGSEEEDLNTLELVNPEIIQDFEQAEAYGKGEGMASSSAPSSQTNEKGSWFVIGTS